MSSGVRLSIARSAARLARCIVRRSRRVDERLECCDQRRIPSQLRRDEQHRVIGRQRAFGSESTFRSYCAMRPSLENAEMTSTSPEATARYMKLAWYCRSTPNLQPIGALDGAPFRPGEDFVVSAIFICGARAARSASRADVQCVGTVAAHRKGIGVFEAERPYVTNPMRACEPCRHFSQHHLPAGQIGALHVVRPHRARIIDIDIDVARASASKMTVEPSPSRRAV